MSNFKSVVLLLKIISLFIVRRNFGNIFTSSKRFILQKVKTELQNL